MTVTHAQQLRAVVSDYCWSSSLLSFKDAASVRPWHDVHSGIVIIAPG